MIGPTRNLAIVCKPFEESRGPVRLGDFDGPIDALLQDGAFSARIELFN
ncbi:hypothetical protein M1105_17115 [Limibaculum sp. FT325]|nr:hypothetical protein [Limibaculum sediminis]MCL5778700.1 hypothetical protein [Limibaculum sediminis]